MIIKKLCEIFNKVNHRSNERAKGIYNAYLLETFNIISNFINVFLQLLSAKSLKLFN
jgi:hypothetical protein